MRSTYREEDVMILLKDITGMIKPLSAFEREKKIQSGVHYSELLPMEYKPTEGYFKLYKDALLHHSAATAQAAAALSEKLWKEKQGSIVLVSLARAGTPIGILVKRYIEGKYRVEVPHYTISIVRDRGIDKKAMEYILDRHPRGSIQFIDGWIGKGAITKELKDAVEGYPGISGELAVLADPARVTRLYGTSDDFLIPSACLNAPVSGLFSRTVWNDQVVLKGDYHGAVYYEDMESIDVSYQFIDAIEGYFKTVEGEGGREGQAAAADAVTICSIAGLEEENAGTAGCGLREVEKIAEDFKIGDINLIKPGIGETTRVLLRRVPWKVLVRDKGDSAYIGHILRLCEEKGIEAIEYPMVNYRACGIIKQMCDL